MRVLLKEPVAAVVCAPVVLDSTLRRSVGGRHK